MLDEYWFGNCNKISPEAPVPITNIINKDFKVGGAGNVALNLAEINSNVALVSTIGKDVEGKIIKKILNNKNIDLNFKEVDGCQTIKKLRIFSKHHQMIRLDFESKKEKYKINLDNKLKK